MKRIRPIKININLNNVESLDEAAKAVSKAQETCPELDATINVNADKSLPQYARGISFRPAISFTDDYTRNKLAKELEEGWEKFVQQVSRKLSVQLKG